MQKRSTRNLQLAALLAATASAHSITTNISVCPTASTTTITLPTTVTYCPGPHCNGGGSGPQITPPPSNGVGMAGVHVGEYTSIGPDGKTTVLGIWETVFDSLCETGLVPATWTITAPCPCEETPHPTVLPTGFETTVVPCSVCGPHSTITLTQPCPTGPYATQTPSTGGPSGDAPAPVGQAPAAAASAGADSSADAVPGGASAQAGAGSDASANAGPGSASAGAGAGSEASANAGPESAEAQASAGSDASANAVSPATAADDQNDVHAAPINGTCSDTGSCTKPVAPIESFISSASQISAAGFTIFAGILASFLL